MADEIIKELWQIKDGIADEYNYDAKAFVAHLRAMKIEEEQRLVDLRPVNYPQNKHEGLRKHS
jgi:hypothetical protein